MSTPITARAEILKVPGASIYYEVRGSGLVLLMMPGGPADAGAFRRIAGYLESDYTVVTYDPRGLSHSTLVAHEPPSPALQPDPERERTAMEEIVRTYRTAGIGPAMQKFMVQTRIRSGPPPPPAGEPTPEMREGMAQMTRNMDFWLGHYFLAISAYEPDFDTLKAGSSRIVPGVGEESRGELANEGGLNLAKRLGTEAVVFPGAHGGFESHAAEFAAR